MAGFLKESRRQISIAANYQDLCERVTREIFALSSGIIARQKVFSMALSGGSTPRGVYECMSSPSYRAKFPWEHMHFFWGDERWVSPENEKSNYRMVSEALFKRVNIPLENIHPIRTMDHSLQDSADSYERNIREFFGSNKGAIPRFDLVLLGLGLDGHTASLFPGNPALSVLDRVAIPVSQEGIPEPRITLTLPVINNADTVCFIVSGLEKAGIVREVLEGEGHNLPANKIIPRQGKLYWFLDRNAASGLQDRDNLG